jgi:UDP-N-acetylglucosamine 4,6-dehydratase (inverting)
VVIHAAALKQVPAMEYNPIEAIKTNIHGAENIIDASIDRGVERIVALSTDKAVNPVNLYGATKLVSDKLFVAANSYVGGKNTVFSVVRYGNVAGSRGSVIPFFLALLKSGRKSLPITDMRMTRFWITLDEGVDLVFRAIEEARGGEIYVAKIPSFKVVDLAAAINPHAELEEVGIRPGEKLHEVMVTREDSRTTYEYDDHYIIYPNFHWWNRETHLKEGGRKVEESFSYASDLNSQWLSVEQIRDQLGRIDIVY